MRNSSVNNMILQLCSDFQTIVQKNYILKKAGLKNKALLTWNYY